MATDISDINDAGVPTFDQFKESLMDVYAEGDLQLTYTRLLWHLRNMTNEGEPLSWEFLLRKFTQHIEQWNLQYGNKLGTKYFPTRSLALRKNFYEFLGEEYYKREFVTSIEAPERTNYLFGEFTMDYLTKQLLGFKNTFPHETG
jgi:hypothetical protein